MRVDDERLGVGEVSGLQREERRLSADDLARRHNAADRAADSAAAGASDEDLLGDAIERLDITDAAVA